MKKNERRCAMKCFKKCFNRKFLRACMLKGSILFCIISFPIPVSAQVLQLFTNVDITENPLTAKQTKIFDRLLSDATTIDVQVVEVDKTLLQNENSITINVFDKSFNAFKQKKTIRSANDFTWFGRSQDKLSSARLTVYQDLVVGNITFEYEPYMLRSLGEGLYALIHIDASKYPPCGNTLLPENTGNPGSGLKPDSRELQSYCGESFLDENRSKLAPRDITTLSGTNTT